jgi:hypothetical protein
MPTWTKSRLVVMVNGTPVTPIDSFTPTFNLNTEVVHSVEATHIGYVANPESFTFTMSVRAIGDGAARLTRLALNGDMFQIVLQEASGSVPTEWEFEQILLDHCIITSANPSNATINGAPAATFSGVCLAVTSTDGAGKVSLPLFGGNP